MTTTPTPPTEKCCGIGCPEHPTPTNTPTSKCDCCCHKDTECLLLDSHQPLCREGYCNKCHTPTTDSKNSSEDWEKEFDSMFDWADQIRATELLRWQMMYGFQPKDLKAFIRSQIQQAEARVSEKYNELLMTVHGKFKGETRHETALRYIRERETGSLEATQTPEHD